MPLVVRRAAALLSLLLATTGCDGSSPPPAGPPPGNRPPVADAGRNLATGIGWITTLDPRASSDPDGDALVPTWFQRSGPPVELLESPDGTTRFIAPAAPATLELGLVVSDGWATSYDEVLVHVVDPGNWPPTAHAGPDLIVPRRSVVQLAGSATDREQDAITFLWEQVAGPPVALLDAGDAVASFVAPPTDVDLEFRLTVGDGLTNEWDAVIVKVRNHPPAIVSAGFSPAAPSTTDALAVSTAVADPDQDPVALAYVWRRNGLVLDGQTLPVLPASATARGDLIAVEITATDGELTASTVGTVTIRDSPPLLSATIPAEVAHGEPVSFAVTASDADEDSVGLALEFGPAGMTVAAGVVSWTPTLPMFDRTLDVRFAIVADAQPAARLEGTIRVVDAGRPYPLRRTAIGVPSWQNGFAAGDLDGNGTAELLVGGERGLFELAHVGNGYAQVWSYPFSDGGSDSVTAVASRDLDGDGKQEIFFASGEQILKLDGVERREVARASARPFGSYLAGIACVDLEVADLDQDGTPELVCLVPSSIYPSEMGATLAVLDALTLAVEWLTPTLGLGRDLAVGQLDGDAALEIVTAGGYVFDGAGGANEWVYGPGFGRAVDTGDLDGDGDEEIVATKGSQLLGYSARAKSPVWEWSTIWPSTYPDALLVADLDGDGVLEIGTADTYWGDVIAYRYRSATDDLAVAFQIPNPDGGASSLAAADLDGDGAVELAWGAGRYTAYVLVVVGPDAVGTRAVEWSSRDPAQPAGPFAGACLATVGGGASRLLFAGAAGARVVSLDPASGAIAVGSKLGKDFHDWTSLETGDVDGDGVEEAFVTTGTYSSGLFTVYDPALAATEWTSPSDVGNGKAVVAADLNDDGAPDLLSITDAGVLHAFDVKNQVLLWKSGSLGGVGMDVAVADLDRDGTREIVALTSGRIVVFRRTTGTVPWLERASATVSGLDLVIADGDGDGLPELHVLAAASATGSTISRFDRNAAALGEIALDAPAASLHVEDLGFARQNLVVATGPSYSGEPMPARLRAIDAESGAEIWASPPLTGTVSRNSLHYVDVDGDGDRDIALGTRSAMYLTR